MSIGHIQEKIKEFLNRSEKRDVYTAFVTILVATSSFFLGKIYSIEAARTPVLIEMVDMPKAPPVSTVATETNQKGKYVASKTGKRYYLLTCTGAKSIADANRVYFDTKESAEKVGLTPATNCKGI